MIDEIKQVDDLNDDNDFYKDDDKPINPVMAAMDAIRELPGQRNSDRINPADPDQMDYIKPGSKAHAAFLGLIPITKHEREKREIENLPKVQWEIEDVTKYGINVTEKYLEIVLRQKISQLTSKVIKPQTTDPFASGYTKEMWTPQNSVGGSLAKGDV